MSSKSFKYIFGGLLIIFLISSGVTYFWTTDLNPQNKPQVIIQEPEEKIFKVTEETKVYLAEKYSICDKYQLNCTEKIQELKGKDRADLNDLTFRELVEKFRVKGETVEKDGNKITITHWMDGLCPEHSNSWHLGLNNTLEYVAVFYGPREVGNEGGIYKVTEIPIKNLSPEYQEKVKNHSLEFYQREELIATLDSLSEFLH